MPRRPPPAAATSCRAARNVGVGPAIRRCWWRRPKYAKPSAINRSIPTLKENRTPSFFRPQTARRLRKHMAIAGLVLRQSQPAGDLVLDIGEWPVSAATQPARSSNLEGHAILFEHRNIAGRCVIKLGGVAKTIAGVPRSRSVVVNAGLGGAAARAGKSRLYSAIGNHPALVDRVTVRGCSCAAFFISQTPHHRIELRPDHQRPMLHQQPFDRLDRNTGTGPMATNSPAIPRRHWQSWSQAPGFGWRSTTVTSWPALAR